MSPYRRNAMISLEYAARAEHANAREQFLEDAVRYMLLALQEERNDR